MSESVKLKEVVICTDAEDLAYTIVRAVQRRRKYYQDQLRLYSSNVYVKSTRYYWITFRNKKTFGN